MSYGFVPGRVYNRRQDIHAVFGGSQQPGIIPTYQPGTRLPGPIFIVSGDGGRASGYADEWLPDGRFNYFGMGQVGDMTMSSGNRAINEAALNGRSILLFEEAGRAHLRFRDEMVCEGYHIVRAPDRNGDLRDAIVFELRPLGLVEDGADIVPSDSASSIVELRERAYAAAGVRPPKAGSKPRTVYERSADVRDYVLARANGDCEGCEEPAPFLRPNGQGYLEPHHIERVSDGGPDHPVHVIALCPNCHRRVHAGADGKTYNDRLRAKMISIEPGR